MDFQIKEISQPILKVERAYSMLVAAMGELQHYSFTAHFSLVANRNCRN
jgi:hypothetical protein